MLLNETRVILRLFHRPPKNQRGAELEWILLAARRKKAGMTRQTEERKASDRSQLSFVGVRWSEKQREEEEEEEDERLRWASKWATALQQCGNTSALVNNQTWEQRTGWTPNRGGRSAQRWVNVERCLTRPPPPACPA